MSKSQVIKSLNEELRQATYVCMLAGEDAHGDNITTEEIRKACHSFNRTQKKANLFHKAMTDSVEFVESYLLPCGISIEDSSGTLRNLEKGTWIVVTQTDSDEIWEAQKNGTISGVSIGALGIREEIEMD